MKKTTTLFIYVTFFVLFPALHLSAQSTVKGFLKDSITREAIPYSSVLLKNMDGTLYSGAISDSSGYFFIDKIKEGNYNIILSYLGYKSKEINITFTKGNRLIELDTLVLSPDLISLQEVLVTADRQLISLKADRKILHVDPAMTAAGESTAELLQFIPEIRVDQDQITLKDQPFSVYVNGKPSTIPASQLFDISASTVERIEVITNPSVRYNTRESGGIVNLIMKKRKLGVNGILQASGGTDNTYRNMATFNYGQKNVNFFISQNGAYQSYSGDGYVHTEYFGQKTQSEDYKDRVKYVYENLKIGFDWDVNEKNLLTLYWTNVFRHGKNKKEIEYREDYINSDSERLKIDYLYNTRFTENTNNIVFNYQHLFDKEDTELTIDVMQTFQSSRNRYWNNEFSPVEKLTYKIYPEDMEKETELDIYFETPFNEKIELNAGLSLDYHITDHDYSGEWLDQGSGIWKDSTSIRNEYSFKELILNPYLLLRFHFNKFHFVAGGRFDYYHRVGQYGNGEVKKDYYSFYPSLSVLYKMSQENNFNFSYSKRVRRPYPFQLNPVAQIGDFETEKILGNPDLDLSPSHSLEMTHLFNKEAVSVNTSVSYIHSPRLIETIYRADLEEGIRYKTWDNVGKLNTFIANSALTWRKSVFTSTLAGSLYYKNYKREMEGVRTESDYLNYDVRFIPVVRLKNQLAFSLQFILYGPENYSTYKRGTVFMGSFTASKTFCQNWTASVRVNNFINVRPEYYNYGEGFMSTSYTDVNNQAVYLGVVYRFGKRINSRADINTGPMQIHRD